MMSKIVSVMLGDKSRLIQSSFLMLFVELVLIRWTGSNVVYLSYFSNFILLGSFLGIGLGFLNSKSSTHLFYLSPLLLAAFVFFVNQFPVAINRTGEDVIFFGSLLNDNALPLWVYLPIIFVMVAGVMASITDGVARTFQKFEALQAYRLDVLGSMLGVIVFSACAFLNATPLCWSVIICVTSLLLLKNDFSIKNPVTYLQIFGLIALILMFGREATTPGYVWSPYYKIGVERVLDQKYLVSVNGIPHQVIESIDTRKKNEPFYFIPYQHMSKKTEINNVLIVGAGTGGDVAIALQKGAKHIDAVEIDPVLYQLGRRLNPNHPYDDARVSMHINDGRAFLQNSAQLYDLIIFALPDSLTLVSGQSSLRLENYLFTVEAMSIMKKHLKQDGVFAMYNYYREKWLVDRLSNTLTTVFNHPPCLDTFGANKNWLSVLTTSTMSSSLQCQNRWEATQHRYITPSTDNHPFLYLKENKIPPLYVTSILLILLISACSIRWVGGSYHSMKSYLDLFFMGTAFLLLETKSIINFALLFGTTWFVNAIVFVGILFTICLAIEFTRHVKSIRQDVLYGFLMTTLCVAWVIPNASLLSLPILLRFISATLLAFAPIFIANLIFANRFRDVANKIAAFSANLVGAILGGLLEYGSLVMGYHNLLIVIAILYTVAIVIMKYSQSSESANFSKSI